MGLYTIRQADTIKRNETARWRTYNIRNRLCCKRMRPHNKRISRSKRFHVYRGKNQARFTLLDYNLFYILLHFTCYEISLTSSWRVLSIPRWKQKHYSNLWYRVNQARAFYIFIITFSMYKITARSAWDHVHIWPFKTKEEAETYCIQNQWDRWLVRKILSI